jgi:hypothetical protein
MRQKECGRLPPQSRQGFAADVRLNEVLVRFRRLDRRQLAVEHLGLEEVSRTGFHTRPNDRRRTVEEDKPGPSKLPSQEVPVCAPKRRAGDDGLPRLGVHRRGNLRQPGPAVGIGESLAARHLRKVGRTVQSVGLDEGPPKSGGQARGDLGLAGA